MKDAYLNPTKFNNKTKKVLFTLLNNTILSSASLN